MVYSVKTADGKVVVLDTGKDEVLYKAPVNPPNSGKRYTRGTDLLAHRAKSGAVYFYLLHWSMWLGESERIELVSHSQAEEFLFEKCAEPGCGHLKYEDAMRLNEQYGFRLYEETA